MQAYHQVEVKDLSKRFMVKPRDQKFWLGWGVPWGQQELKLRLQDLFETIDLGLLHYFLHLQITKSSLRISLSQPLCLSSRRN